MLRAWIQSTASFVVVLVAIATLGCSGSGVNLPLPAHAPVKGAAAPQVVVQEISDFQCPYCAQAYPTIEQLLTMYEGRVRVVWRHYPLPMHPDAMLAAEASQEVFEQAGSDKFWAYAETLFANQHALGPADLERYARELGGLDMERFRRALETHQHRARIMADIEAVDRATGGTGVPAFVINGNLVVGALPIEQMHAEVQKHIPGGGCSSRANAPRNAPDTTSPND